MKEFRLQSILARPIPLVFSVFLFLITLLPKISTVLLLVLVVFWILEGNWKDRVNFIRINKGLLLMPLFFLLHLISLLYSSNLSVGFQKIETLLSLFILPLVLPTFKRLNFQAHLKQYKWAFIFGVLFNLMFCISRSTILFIIELINRDNGIYIEGAPYTNWFFYSYLSYFIHYGYMAMYVNAAIAILFSSLIKNSNKNRSWSIILIVLFSVFVLMLYSKAGILAMMVLYLYFILYQLIKYGNTRSALISFSLLIILGFVLFNFIPYTKERIQGMIYGVSNIELDPKSHDSTQLRVFVWKASKELIQENWLTGYGVGDTKTELLERYEKNGFVAALDEKLNAHNQFFQTFLNVGISGVIFLLFYLVQLFLLGVRASNFHLQVFALLTFLVFLFESYLQTQKGIYYFIILAVFFSIEASYSLNDPKKIYN